MKKLFVCLIIAANFAVNINAEVPFFPYHLNWLAAVTGNEVPRAVADEPVVNNRYLMESIRANNLARLAFADGDYDLSMQFSADALRAARLSDELITQKLKIAAANEKIDEAENRLGWADSTRARVYYPKEYNNAKAFYNQALLARTAGEWGEALNNAIYAVQALSLIASPPAEKASDKNAPLPAQYTVRPWDTSGDCLWNIAGRPWAYGDPHRWPVLLRANKSKFPNPNNPNLIEPGIVLDIPSIRGEIREGMWDSGKKYVPLSK